jgi:hypothetical protein
MHNIIKNIRRMATILEARATERERERKRNNTNKAKTVKELAGRGACKCLLAIIGTLTQPT